MKEDKREQVIQAIVNIMRDTVFDVKFEVKKKPAGIKVIIEVTQEQMDAMMDNMKQKFDK